MEKQIKITISNPNPYKAETGTEMVAYVVTGEGAEQYRQEQLAKGIDSVDDNGNPLMHFSFDAAVKYGEEAELISGTVDGKPIWFMDNDDHKQLEKLLNGNGTNATVKSILAQREVERIENFLKVLSRNRKANIAKLLAKRTEEFTNVKKK